MLWGGYCQEAMTILMLRALPRMMPLHLKVAITACSSCNLVARRSRRNRYTGGHVTHQQRCQPSHGGGQGGPEPKEQLDAARILCQTSPAPPPHPHTHTRPRVNRFVCGCRSCTERQRLSAGGEWRSRVIVGRIPDQASGQSNCQVPGLHGFDIISLVTCCHRLKSPILLTADEFPCVHCACHSS
jgi:hypothetical protein